MREKLLRIANRVTPAQTLKVVDDPDDDRIVECAVEAGPEFIVTNDKAILRLGESTARYFGGSGSPASLIASSCSFSRSANDMALLDPATSALCRCRRL